MKIKILLLLLAVSLHCQSQISVGDRHIGKPVKLNEKTLDKFKKTETIFVFSEAYEKEVYEQILKDTWTITPYKIIEYSDFKIEDYLPGNYSIARLGGYKKIKDGRVSGLYIFFDMRIYHGETILEELKELASRKMSSKKRTEKEQNIINSNYSNIARFYIYPKDDFIHTALSEEMDVVYNSLFKDDVFFNYKPGLLKNYFQKVNNLIKDEEVYWMYENDFKPEIKKLKSNKLYIPSYISVEYNGWKATDSEADDENIHDTFKEYEYEYEIISDNDLSDKIMNSEEIYYLRYVRMNTERFLQVVNSKTGDVIYRQYVTGLAYKIKPKHIDDLNKAIRKALKS